MSSADYVDSNKTPPERASESPAGNTGESPTNPKGQSSDGSPRPLDLKYRQDSVSDLQVQAQTLRQEIDSLKATYTRILKAQAQTLQNDLGQLVRQNLTDLERRRQELQTEVEKLERRKERIQAEMRTSFAGVSQDLAVRVQGFKDYLVGSLQDLAAAAEQLELAPKSASREPEVIDPARQGRSRPPSRGQSRPDSDDPFADFDAPIEALRSPRRQPENRPAASPAARSGFTSQRFDNETQQVLDLLDQYRLSPNYYGPVWQLRRTFEPVHADRLKNWFLNLGGRGAIKSMGSRLQNVLIASAAASVLRVLYGDRLRLLVLANTPERLGEWRRGLQDCLGVSRGDFGTNRGIMLFEAPEPLAQRAERLVEMDLLPLLLVDEAEDKISLSLLQFPLWLVFAPDPLYPAADYDFY